MSKKIRKLIMLAMLLLLIIGVGYASLKINISIDGTTTIKNNNFVIKLANIVTKEGSVIPTNSPTIGADAMSINFDVTLSNPGEYYEFNVDVVNRGTLNAEIENYTITELTEQQLKYLTFEVKYSDGSEIKKGDVLSINGQINSLGQILGGPIIGIIATNISVSMGIACTSLLVTPVLVLYIVAMIMDKKVVDRVGGIDYEENN